MASTTLLYGISNCDTINKARKWLQQRGVEFEFHDYRKNGLDAAQLRSWEQQLGWEALLNRRGTTWRKLPEVLRESVDREQAIELMLEFPAMIKRPLLVKQDQLLLGFKPEQYDAFFG